MCCGSQFGCAYVSSAENPEKSASLFEESESNRWRASVASSTSRDVPRSASAVAAFISRRSRLTHSTISANRVAIESQA